MIFITPHILTRGNIDSVTSEKMAIVRPPKAESQKPSTQKEKGTTRKERYRSGNTP
jgi:hypothetical protein